ncbi:ABC transporter substrate-binding protein [Myroides albus]|uniref:ABC transporter substrate-binding protein n=1 Tax=Myroides albus TaxID=2562892 RepID=A0A6I3LPW0_9FLAO|nr:ABC transporter substrate-binding protein [Myroides albus]MTG98005.1 ABC transporter substrate-binding protein [Myroides albus]UVD80296.1 ABC transporter substrate-binding protein [Myroides albus]
MKKGIVITLSVLSVLFGFTSCKKQIARGDVQRENIFSGTTSIAYAKGLEIEYHEDYSLVNISQPWAGSSKTYSYVLAKKEAVLPDSLKNRQRIEVPVKDIVVTSTTHIPALELLNEVGTLRGFPGLDYISTPVVRQLINEGKVKELGSNESLNTEQVIDLEPGVVVAFAMDDSNKSLQTIAQSGIAVLYNGDWVEQTPLGKAEWIKLYGVLFDKREKAERLFTEIEEEYQNALKLVNDIVVQPTVMSGVMYQDVWYMPGGGSWAGIYFKDAVSDYLWKDTEVTGSLALSFESVFDKAKDAEYWINPGHYETLAQLKEANPHYANFKSFQSGKVFSFAPTKGSTGGTVFYELGPTRPDLVLKDLIYIFHPEVLPGYEPVFYKQLK